MNFLQLNKFSELHNNSSIIFCKTDYLHTEFLNISERKKDCILISGNSDYGITDDIISYIPKYVKKWFAQNAISNNSLLVPIPLGLENKKECYRHEHGIGYEKRMKEKEEEIIKNRITNTNPIKFIYLNCNIHTNLSYRTYIRGLALSTNYIDIEQPSLSISELYSNYSEYKMILCPIGNGVDTHRLWEVLYLNRIPITIKVGNFNLYRMYEELPIVLLENHQELLDKKLIEDKYYIAQDKLKGLEQKLDYNYWKNLILKEHEKLQ